MRVYPAMDLLEGRVVRLRKGELSSVSVFSADPVGTAQEFERCGAQYLHVVDLNGACGNGRQTQLMRTIIRSTHLTVEVGGGIRTLADASQLKDAGVERVILGSIAVRDAAETLRILESLGGDAVALAVDVRLDETGAARVATDAWMSLSSFSVRDVLTRYRAYDPWVLCTDIARDGMLDGPNVPLYMSLVSAFPGVRILASGGVSTVDDIAALRAANVAGVVLGRALYEGKLSLCDVLSYQSEGGAR